MNHHALIVSSSRYWFNYRHAINALTVYQLLKDNGVDDRNIVLMIADEFAINPRNVLKNEMYAGDRIRSLYNAEIEIDYREEDVTVENAVLALTGRQRDGLPQLNTDPDSQILIYWTGHGGDQFFKFQDVEEIMASDISAAISQMHLDSRYNEILMIADTCQAFTLGDKIVAPNVTFVGSSLKDESSYAHHSDSEIGLAAIERYTYSLAEFVKKNGLSHNLQKSMVDPYSFASQRAHIGASDALAVRKLREVPLSDFMVARTPPKPAILEWERPNKSIRVPLPPSESLLGPPWKHNRQTARPIASDAFDPTFLALTIALVTAILFVLRRCL